MRWFHIFKIMNTSYPAPGISGIAPLKIPLILLLLIVLLSGGLGSTLYAQNDSIEITAVPLREIANEAAADRQQTRDILVAKVQVSTSYELISQIDSLATEVAQLDELTKQTLSTRLDYAYYSSLILRW
jgi:hypothetical protein